LRVRRRGESWTVGGLLRWGGRGFSLYFFAFLSCLFYFLHVILHVKSKKAKKKVKKK